MKERFDPELGEMERYCPDCDEWWPATREFFYPTGKKGSGRLHSYCKACYEVRRNRRRRARAHEARVFQL